MSSAFFQPVDRPLAQTEPPNQFQPTFGFLIFDGGVIVAGTPLCEGVPRVEGIWTICPDFVFVVFRVTFCFCYRAFFSRRVHGSLGVYSVRG